MSAKAGLVIKTPEVIPIKVVIAKPFNKPAPAHNKGIKATTAVKYAPRIIVNALFNFVLYLMKFFALLRRG